MAKFWKAINESCVTSAQFNKPLFFNNLGMSLDGMSLKEARKLLDSIKEKLELVLSKNRDSEIITNGNSHEKNGNSTIIQNQNGDSKKENNDSQQPKEDGKKEKVFNCQNTIMPRLSITCLSKLPYDQYL